MRLLALMGALVGGLGTANAEKAVVGEFDLLVLYLTRDVQDHVLYIQLAHDQPTDLYRFVMENLALRMFDLNNYLAKTENRELIELTCGAAFRLSDDLTGIVAGCKGEAELEICNERDRLERLCVEQRKTWKGEGD
jgi:hypothetical protein